MSEEIKAALTAEGWARRDKREAQMAAVARDFGIDLGDEDEKWYHSIAALALYGQPYGFTWEMVDALESAASRLERDLGLTDEYTVACNRAIACIAALLPPRSP